MEIKERIIKLENSLKETIKISKEKQINLIKNIIITMKMKNFSMKQKT